MRQFRAHAKRTELGLSDLEIFDLKALRGHHLVSVSVGILALAVALATLAPLNFSPFSPVALGLMGPGHGLWAMVHNRQRQALERRLVAAPALTEPAPVEELS